MKQLAIIDDDPEILKLLDQYLTKNSFEVDAFKVALVFKVQNESAVPKIKDLRIIAVA